MSKISKIAVPGVAEPYDIGTLSIPFGQVDSTSTDTAYTAQIEGITSLYDGVCVYLKNGVITSNKNGFTLNINGLGAKPVYDTLAAATRSGTVFNVDYTMLFVYNSSRVSGGCWDIFYGYNSDTTNLEEALTPLTGTTETLTPTQVYDAIKSGKSVVLQHTHSLLGLFTFASFNIFEREKTVVSTSIAKNGGTYLVGSLAGLAGSNEWVFNITEMAEVDDIPVAVNEALAQAKASGEFDGADGKSAYAYAQDGGYTGTEEQFAAKLAKEMPTALPNPNALTFTGAVTGSYDGSAPLEVAIPNGGGSGFDEWECINTFTIPADTAEDVTSIIFSEDAEGKPFALKKFYAVFAGIAGWGTYFCIRINDLPITQQFGTNVITNNQTGKYNPLRHYFEIAGPGFYYWACPNVSSFGYRTDGEITFNGGLQSNISQVNKISFAWGTNSAITPGTTVKLWGVRT